MTRMIGRRKRRSRAIIFVALLAGLIGFSLAVRWLGLGARFAREEEPAFQIEVLNGTKETGIAMDVAKELRRRGIDVLIVDNAERFDFKESVLVDRRGNPRLMRRLAKTARMPHDSGADTSRSPRRRHLHRRIRPGPRIRARDEVRVCRPEGRGV